MKGKFTVFVCLLSWSQPSYSQTNITTPVDQETCFSPEEPCDLKLLKFIESSEHSINVAIYSINLDNLVEALIEKSKKIKVRVVCDKLQASGATSKVLYLLENGVNIRYGRQKGIMHDKFVIVDESMIETGSFNYTNHAKTSNEENQVYLSGHSIVSRFQERFEKIWDNSVEINLHELVREIDQEKESL
jgi:phosphatidylserine/phosphatidylglycerophosphate/cardiolipin synthase-like enzyme